MIGWGDIKKIIENFKRRNIEAYYFENVKQAEHGLLDEIPLGATVGIGNSQTLKEMKITEKLKERGNPVFDKTTVNSKIESNEISKKALLSDWYIMSSNAVSKEGHIVNIDHTGNRVAALIYGPEKVVVIIGVNKIENSLDAAIGRARNTAAILNARRAGLNPPCVELNRCVDCRSKDRACNNLVIVEGQVDKDRLKVFIVNESVGF